MHRIIGSIMVIAACSVMGFQKSRELQQHLTDLEELKKVFVLLRSEFQYTKAPLAEVFLKISKKSEKMYQVWLALLAERLNKLDCGTLQTIWETSVDTCLKDSTLNREELEELCKVGNGLGYIETIDIYLTRLDISIESTREELKNKKKLYQTIGVMCGVFLVIVLL